MRKDEEIEYAELLKLAYQADRDFNKWDEEDTAKYGQHLGYDGRDGGEPEYPPESPIDFKVKGEILKTKKTLAWQAVKNFKVNLGISS